MFVLQVLGDVSTQDTVGKSLYDSCFTGTRFTDKNRVVLGTPTQNLQDTPYLFVTADDGISLPLRAASFRLMAYFSNDW